MHHQFILTAIACKPPAISPMASWPKETYFKNDNAVKFETSHHRNTLWPCDHLQDLRDYRSFCQLGPLLQDVARNDHTPSTLSQQIPIHLLIPGRAAGATHGCRAWRLEVNGGPDKYGNYNRDYVFPGRSSFKMFCHFRYGCDLISTSISNSHPPSNRPTIQPSYPTVHFLIPRLDSIMFSVLLDHGSAARCKGNGKHGKAPSVDASCPASAGAMDSKGGRNRGQKAVVAAANRYSRHGSNRRRSTTAMLLRQWQRSTKRASRCGQKAPLRKMIKKDGNVLKPLRTTAERERKYESHHGATSYHVKPVKLLRYYDGKGWSHAKWKTSESLP